MDCASLPQNLVESTLFGHKKGSFTGADRARDGLIRQAHEARCFLMRSELPFHQKSFLRVLQMRAFRPIGSDTEITSDFRLISARTGIWTGWSKRGSSGRTSFSDTYTADRSAAAARAPKYKELLVHYVARLCEQYGVGNKGFSPEFLAALGRMTGRVTSGVHQHVGKGYFRRRFTSLRSTRNTCLPRYGSGSKDPNSTWAPAPNPIAKPRNPFQFSGRTVRKRSLPLKKYLERVIKISEGRLREICRLSGSPPVSTRF